MAEHRVDVALVGGEGDELHASLTPGAGEDVGGEHPAEEPWPGMPRRRGSGRWLERRVGADLEERELFWLFFFRERRSRNDLGPDLGMRSENAVIAKHVKPRRRDEGAEACEKIEGVENDRARPVFPGGLEAVANSAVLTNVESVLCERRPGHVTAEALESLAVAAVDRDLGVDVDAADFGDRVVRGGATRESGTDEFCGLVSRAFPRSWRSFAEAA